MNLESLLEPKSIAVIGVSRKRESVGYAVMKNLLEATFRGKIYPVNAKSTEWEGMPCYPSLREVPGNVDLAVIIVPAVFVPDIIEQCGRKKVKAMIVISAGFKEVGEVGKKLEEDVLSKAREYGIPLMGPNCLGLMNTDSEVSLNASFARSMPPAGNIAFISQSGALCTAVLDYAQGENLGFSKFISLGNKADINELHFLQYLKNDKQTSVILLYLEDLVDGRAFIELAREISGEIASPKPMLVIKSGRTAAGAKAAKSHTGSLMGSDEAFDAIFSQAGVLRCETIEEMFDWGLAFSRCRIPKGNRVAIITNAGGPGIMTADACVRNGLEMASLSPSSVARLKKVLPETAGLGNPVDVIGDARHDRYGHAIDILISDPGVDSLLIILTPQAMTDIEEIAKVIVQVEGKSPIPMVTCFMGVVDVSGGIKVLKEAQIPNYRFPEGAAKALGAMDRYRKWLSRPRTKVRQFKVDRGKVQNIIEQAQRSARQALCMQDALEVLQAYGFPMLPFKVVKTEEDAVSQAEGVGFPLVMKIVSEDILHKSDVGGVKLGLQNKEEVKTAYQNMMLEVKQKAPKARREGVLIQKMALKGREVILGMNRDPKFGPVLMFGLGGIYVEVLKDVTFRLAPIRELGAEHMIESIRSISLLKGARGEPPSDLKSLGECLLRLSQLVSEQSGIEEIDMNPVMVYPEGEGSLVADIRILIHP
ncbi:MAG: acetate--CoA ligase family protein [Candidatus Omnitrophica bacterium]|nr:acetate--CoA ligase family protein [Candidatus Omnitrophota bacterium]